ncbi:TPA: DNA-binding protein, partial [Streptococcus suis]
MLPQNNSPLLLNRQQAAELLGIDPKSFDKYIR